MNNLLTIDDQKYIISNLKDFDYCFLVSWFFNSPKDYKLLFIWNLIAELKQINDKTDNEFLRQIRLTWWKDYINKCLNPDFIPNAPLLILLNKLSADEKTSLNSCINQTIELYSLLIEPEIDFIAFDQHLNSLAQLISQIFFNNSHQYIQIFRDCWLILHPEIFIQYLEYTQIDLSKFATILHTNITTFTKIKNNLYLHNFSVYLKKIIQVNQLFPIRKIRARLIFNSLCYRFFKFTRI